MLLSAFYPPSAFSHPRFILHPHFLIRIFSSAIRVRHPYPRFIPTQTERWLLTVYWKTRAQTHGHGQADTDTDTDSYGKDGQLWKRRTLMEKTDTYGIDRNLWKRQTQSI